MNFMKKRLSFTLIIGVLAASLASAGAAVTASKKLPDGAQFTVDGGTLRIQFWSEEIVRVTYAGGAELPALKSLSVVASPAAVHWTRQENDRAFTLATPHVKVRIDKQTGAVDFLDTAGHLLLREVDQGRKFQPATQAGVTGTSCTQSLSRQRMKASTDWASISGARGTMRPAAASSGSPKPTRTWLSR